MTITKNLDFIIFLSDQLFCWKKYLQPKGARKSSENLLPRSKFFVFKNLCNVIAINYSIYHIFLVSAKFCSILVYLHTFFGWYVVCLFRRFGINRLWHTSIMDHMVSRTPSAFAVKNVVVLFAQKKSGQRHPNIARSKIGKTRAAPQCKDRQPL